MCWYCLTFDLDLDLEHILDAGPSGDHRVQVWSRSSHLSGYRGSDLRKMFTDERTDGQTDDGRRAIALARVMPAVCFLFLVYMIE